MPDQPFAYYGDWLYEFEGVIGRTTYIRLFDAAPGGHTVRWKFLQGVRRYVTRVATIHHAAFDANILGIDPDCVVHVRRDILEEHDGPMLRYGLQETEGNRILRPRSPAKRPRPEYLEERFERFRAA